MDAGNGVARIEPQKQPKRKKVGERKESDAVSSFESRKHLRWKETSRQ